MKAPLGKPEQELEAVSVGSDSAGTGVLLLNQPLHEELLQ